MFRLSALYRYPIKSSAAESLERVALDALGVVGDRRWMAVDTETGRFFTQRLLPQLGRIQARWAAPEVLRLNAPGMSELSLEVPAADANLRGVTVWRDTLQAPDAGDAAADWLTRFLGRPTRLVHIPEARARQVDTGYAEPGQKVHFADGFPLLLIGQASLDDLSQRVGRPLEMPSQPGGGRQRRVRRGRLETHPHRLGRVRRGQALFPLHPHHPGSGDRRAQRGPRAADDPEDLPGKGWRGAVRAEPDCAGTG